MLFEQIHHDLLCEYLQDDCNGNFSLMQRQAGISQPTLKKWQNSQLPLEIDATLWNRFLENTGLIYDVPELVFVSEENNNSVPGVKETNLFDDAMQKDFLRWLNDTCQNNISAANRLTDISIATLRKWKIESTPFRFKPTLWQKFIEAKNQHQVSTDTNSSPITEAVMDWRFQWLKASCSSSDQYKHLQYIYHDENRLVATDGHIMSLIKAVSSSLLNKLPQGYLNHTGSPMDAIDTNFPDYLKIIPERSISESITFSRTAIKDADKNPSHSFSLSQACKAVQNSKLSNVLLSGRHISLLAKALSKSGNNAIKVSCSNNCSPLLFELHAKDALIQSVVVPQQTV